MFPPFDPERDERKRRQNVFTRGQVPVRVLIPNIFTLVGLCAGWERVPDQVGEQLGLMDEQRIPRSVTLLDILARDQEEGPRWGHPALWTSAAYDLAYHTLFAALPPCWECYLR